MRDKLSVFTKSEARWGTYRFHARRGGFRSPEQRARRENSLMPGLVAPEEPTAQLSEAGLPPVPLPGSGFRLAHAEVGWQEKPNGVRLMYRDPP
jgi:hypothetical protein